MAEMPEMPDGRPLAVVTEQALIHSGVQATRLEIDMAPGEAGEDVCVDAGDFAGNGTQHLVLGDGDDLVVDVRRAGLEVEQREGRSVTDWLAVLAEGG